MVYSCGHYDLHKDFNSTCQMLAATIHSFRSCLRVVTSKFLSHCFRFSTFFLLKASSMHSPSSSPLQTNFFLCCCRAAKYSFASFGVLVPNPCTPNSCKTIRGHEQTPFPFSLFRMHATRPSVSAVYFKSGSETHHSHTTFVVY